MTAALRDIALTTIDGGPTSLGDYAGKVLLIVNVASQCGLTPQYEALEKLYRDYADRGLVVLGFPANEFGAQEPGSDEEIAGFCSANYGVTFPMHAKLVATGPDKHPLYAALTAAHPDKAGDADAFRERLRSHGITPTEGAEVTSNFEKFVVGADGEVAARFAPDIAPDDPAVIAAIEAELAKA